MDHDRQDGEGHGPQEYTGVKLEVSQWSDAAKAAIGDKAGDRKVYFVAATLRPETMYGQTNCFVGTSLKYGLFAANDKEAYICTLRAARNMAFQNIFPTWGEYPKVVDLVGSDVVGTLFLISRLNSSSSMLHLLK